MPNPPNQPWKQSDNFSAEAHRRLLHITNQTSNISLPGKPGQTPGQVLQTPNGTSVILPPSGNTPQAAFPVQVLQIANNAGSGSGSSVNYGYYTGIIIKAGQFRSFPAYPITQLNGTPCVILNYPDWVGGGWSLTGLNIASGVQIDVAGNGPYSGQKIILVNLFNTVTCATT